MNDETPVVSIVTPSFNQGRFIRATIDSVLAQGYPRIEYVVMDGGSADETLDVLRGYGDRLTWLSESDRGQAHAINKGWRRTRGEVVAFLNSDDVYLPGAVAKAVAGLRAHPEAAGVYGEGYHVDAGGQILERYPTEPFSVERLEETCFICQPTVFLRRAVVEQVGWLDESLRYCMDYDLWVRVARRRPLVRLPEYLAHSRLHPDTKTLGQRVPAHAEILAMVYRHFGRVSPSWVYAYAHAVLAGRRRDTARTNASFVVRLIGISLVEFLRWNHGVPRAEWVRWGGWVAQGWRKLREPAR